MRARLILWRNAAAGWFVAAFFCVLGVPLFLHMPLWCDITLYDVAARNILTGGTHYRDVFDTNTPGFVWLLCGIRAAFGWSTLALRIVDLGIVASSVILLLRWSRAAGSDAAARAWAAAAMAGFYLFISEFNHAQRDVWMLLPAIVAVRLRVVRITHAASHSSLWVYQTGLLEGLIWASAFWIKPHICIPAIVVWLSCARRFAGTTAHPVYRLFCDLAGVLTGGLILGALGIGWMIRTGTWPHFLDVFVNWNASYLSMILNEMGWRFWEGFRYFPPWSLALIVAIPLAVRTVRTTNLVSADHEHFNRIVLSAFFLGWAAMALGLQRSFHYVHVPETLLMFALFAAHRLAVPFVLLTYQLVLNVLLLNPFLLNEQRRLRVTLPVTECFVSRHAAFLHERTRCWPNCFVVKSSRELQRDVGLQGNAFGGIDPVELGAVEDYLRAQNVADGEVIGWHSSTHPLYLSLHVKPAIRFMHLSTVQEIGPWQYEQVKCELAQATPLARFAVSDLHCVTSAHDRLNDVGVDELPRVLPAWQRGQFPFNQPVVFRSPSGRYIVHAVVHPAEAWDCKIPRCVDDTHAW